LDDLFEKKKTKRDEIFKLLKAIVLITK
jgi:hypothetical protein